jgi:hypothetical protein
MPYTPPRETLAATAFRLISEALATRVVLAHTRAAFHPYMCGLHGGDAALIGYDNQRGCCWETREEEMIVIEYFLYIDA